MNWYLTKMVFQIICGNGKHTPQFDEQLRLIQANNTIEAHQKAQELGFKEDSLSINEQRQPVRWKFIAVPEVYLLENIVDGTEVYSRVEEKEDARNYINMLRSKEDKITTPILSKV